MNKDDRDKKEDRKDAAPPSRRRLLTFLMIDAFILLSVMGVFAAVNHGLSPAPPPLSERILITPTDRSDASLTASAPASVSAPTGASASASAPAPATQAVSDAELAPQPLPEGHLLSRSVSLLSYKLTGKDNYWTVADTHGINLNTLIGANPDLPFKAHLGLTVHLLSRRGILHEVYPGETLKGICALYKVDEKVLKDENTIHWWRGVRAGDVLFIPDVKPLRMLAEWRNYFSQRGFFGVPFAHWGEAVTSGFGWRHDPITGERQIHPGMDFRAKVGEDVYASAAGKVVFAGVAGGYGNLIKIHHNSTYTTYYGHLSQILVKPGQKVKRGQLIGKVGATGHVTGPHLHFEIRRNGRPINPLPLI